MSFSDISCSPGEPRDPGEILFGTAGWSYPDWEGRVYPEKKGKGFHPLGYLSGFVDVVEVNSTFYRPPVRTLCAKWVELLEGQPRFQLAVKLWRGFTHERTEIRTEDVRAFQEGVAPLVESGRLGALLMQFPWSFRASPPSVAWLDQLIQAFGSFPIVVEVRHASWGTPEFCSFLAERGVGIANIDQPLFARSIGPSARVTSKVGYVRLHGRNYENWFRESAGRDDRYDYLYSLDELKEWLGRIETVGRRSLKTFVIANNHYGGQALVNALELKHLATGRRVAVPPALLGAYPRLAAVAQPGAGEMSGQAELPLGRPARP